MSNILQKKPHNESLAWMESVSVKKEMLSKIFMRLLSILFACIKFDIEKVKQLYKGLRCKCLTKLCWQVNGELQFVEDKWGQLSGKLKLPKNELVTLVICPRKQYISWIEKGTWSRRHYYSYIFGFFPSQIVGKPLVRSNCSENIFFVIVDYIIWDYLLKIVQSKA